jgi:transposase-like protein
MSYICSQREIITIGDQSMSARAWAEMLGVSWATVKMRRHRGWSWSEALGPPRRRLLDPYR